MNKTGIVLSYLTSILIATSSVKWMPLTYASSTQGSNELSTEASAFTNLKNRPYDEEAYQLAYKTLIFNSHIRKAYELAKIAVAKNPHDLTWHQHLAQTATWLSEDDTAMTEWLYVAKHTQNFNTMKQAISTAKLFGYDRVLVTLLNLYLTKVPSDQYAYLELADALNRNDEPHKALLTLQTLNQSHPSRAAFEMEASIESDLGDWDAALKTWQKIDKMFGPNLKSVMAEAVIYYSRKQFRQAVAILKQGIPLAKKTDDDFWQTLAQLAWMINDRPFAILGYQHQLKDSSSLVSLIELERVSQPNLALFYSMLGWSSFHQPLFFSSALSMAVELKKWQTLNDLFIQLSAKDRSIAEKNLQYWQTLALLCKQFGVPSLQKYILAEGVITQPKLLQLSSDLLWLFLDNGEYPSIKALMERLNERFQWQDPLLWHAFAEGFDELNNYPVALIIYQMHLLQNLQKSQVWIDYAKLLIRANLDEEAYEVWRALWFQNETKVSASGPDSETLRALSQVAPYMVSGTDQVTYLSALLNGNSTDEDTNIVLNWIVPRNDEALLSFFKAYYMNNVLPDWAQINLSVMKNDLPTLQKIIEHQDRTWPRADRINAAVHLENTPLAVDYAFAELTERPMAHEIYNEFTQYGLLNANHVNIGQEFEEFVGVVGPRTKAEAKLRLTNTWKITPSASLWHIRSNEAMIVNLPSEVAQVGITLDQKVHRGNVVYGLLYRQSLNGFVPLSIDYH